jgi:hypothetical protein
MGEEPIILGPASCARAPSRVPTWHFRQSPLPRHRTSSKRKGSHSSRLRSEPLQKAKMPADLLPAECFGLPQPPQRLLWQPSLHAEDDDLMKLYAGGIELGQEFGLGEPLRTTAAAWQKGPAGSRSCSAGLLNDRNSPRLTRIVLTLPHLFRGEADAASGRSKKAGS